MYLFDNRKVNSSNNLVQKKNIKYKEKSEADNFASERSYSISIIF